jgi:hypothetical protein
MAHLEVCKRLNFDVNLTQSQYWEFKVNSPANFFQLIGLPEQLINNYSSVWKSIIESDELLSFDKIHKFAKNDLIDLSLDFSIWLISLRSNSLGARKLLKSYGIDTIFDNIFFLKHKASDIFIKSNAIKKLNIPTDYFICFIGDSEVDILAAQDLKVPSYSVLTGVRSKIFLDSFPYTTVFDTLSDIKNELCNR